MNVQVTKSWKYSYASKIFDKPMEMNLIEDRYNMNIRIAIDRYIYFFPFTSTNNRTTKTRRRRRRTATTIVNREYIELIFSIYG